MRTTYSGTVHDGALQLDAPVELANESRVQVTIVPLEDWRKRWREALDALVELRKTNPIDSGGVKFTREQLYDRG
jgi:hypothetical protein